MAGAYGAVAVLLLAACGSGDDDATDTAPATTAAPATTTTTAPSYEPVVESAPCDGEVPDDPRVECGVLTVPMDRNDPDAGDVTIPYAIVHSPDPAPLDDPIIYFSGGPGDAGRDIADFLVEIGIAGGPRDVIVFDQRGTGASTPSLDCPEYTEAVWELLAAPAPPLEELAISDAALGACRARLLADGVDLDAYDTPTTAADIEDLRVALGIDRWNLFGVSYGTTVALEVVRQHPESVRSVVLDSVYAVESSGDSSARIVQAERVFGVLADGCAADPGCASAHGDVMAGLRALFDAWNADPYEATIEDPVDGRQRQLVITGEDVVAGLWNALYDDQLIGVLPSLLAPLLAREPLADVVVGQLATDGIDQLTAGAEGIASVVDCADRGNIQGPSREEVMAAEPFYAGLIALGDRSCELWDVEPVDPSFNDTVRSDLPALLFGNEYDPVTPPEDTERTARGFVNGTYVEFPGLGHGSVFSHRCPTQVMLAFVDDPAAPVDMVCVDEMGQPAWAV